MKMRASLSSDDSVQYGGSLLGRYHRMSMCIPPRENRNATGRAGKSIQDSKVDSKWSEAYGKLPMGFEKNKGQTNSDVRFLARGQGYELFLTPQEAVVELRNSKSIDFSPAETHCKLRDLHSGKRRVLPLFECIWWEQIRIQKSQDSTSCQGKQTTSLETIPRSGGQTFRRTLVSSTPRIYPGIDLVFYGNQRKLSTTTLWPQVLI